MNSEGSIVCCSFVSMYIISDMEVIWNVSGEEMLSLLILINQNIWGFSTENIDVSLGFQKL